MTRYQYGRRILDPRQQYRRWIDPRIRTLRVKDVVAYLVHRGWKEVPPDRDHFLAFREPAREGEATAAFYQFVPDSEADDTYPQMMFELITGLAEFEDRQAPEVIDDIVGQRSAGDIANGPMARIQPIA